MEFSSDLAPDSWSPAFTSSGPANTAGSVTVAHPAPGTTGFILTGLLAGSDYDVKILSHNIAGTSHSTTIGFDQPANPPALTALQQWNFLHWGSLTPSGDRAPAGDFDRDGVPNVLEFALGSFPRHAASMPALTAALTAEGRLALTFARQAAPELTYTVEFSSELAPDSWSPDRKSVV